MSKEIVTVEDYIASFDERRQTKLELLRYIIMDEVPGVTEKLVMGIPTYHYHGMLFSFAGQQEHYYFYPGINAIKAYHEDVENYILGKNTLGFSYDSPLPEEIVKLLINFRVKENMRNK